MESPQTHQQQFVSSTEMRSESSTGTAASSALAVELGTFLSFSCRSRAEDFARRLQIRLNTLESFEGSGDELRRPPSWKSLSLDSHLRLKNQQQKAETSSTSKEFNGTGLESRMTPSQNGPPVTSSSSQQRGQNGESSLDSDIYFDFDLASPASPTDGNCAVINPCDDLYCNGCVQRPSSSDAPHPANHSSSGSQNKDEHGSLESGCIFTSPENTSPDSGGGGGELQFLPILNIQHSNSGDDCTSDTSDGSIYYDVEPFSISPIPSPRSELHPQLTTTPATTPERELSELSISGKYDELKVTTVEQMKQLLSNFGNYTSGDTGVGSENDSSDDDNVTLTIPRLIRSSSLKTGKTPPGTPGTKKIVRFADSLGLDLTAVRTFMDEIPKVPKSAFRDLDCPIDSFATPFSAGAKPPFQKTPPGNLSKTLVPTFHQPVTRPDFFDRVRDNKVLLENVYFCDDFTITGSVRVLNMDFHKSVYIRYTYDEWKTFTDFQATYVNGSCDGFSDKFEFTIYLRPEMIEIGSRLILAVRFHCKGEQFWDNNCGSDYLFHCVPGSVAQPPFHSSSMYPSMYGSSPDDPWTNHMWF